MPRSLGCKRSLAKPLGATWSDCPPGTIPNADYLAQMLQKETDRVVGQKGAKLLLGTILIN